MARILIAEDHTLVRQGMRVLLESEGFEVEETSDGAAAFKRIQEGNIDLVLLDIGLPVRSGLDVLQEVRKRGLPVKVVVLTGDTARYAPGELYQLGADGFLYKTAKADHMLETLDSVLKGETLHSEDTESQPAEQRDQLTDRERQIVKLVVEGASNKEAAQVLSISEHTVRKHREHINRKLSIRSPAALAAFAIRTGLVS